MGAVHSQHAAHPLLHSIAGPRYLLHLFSAGRQACTAMATRQSPAAQHTTSRSRNPAELAGNTILQAAPHGCLDAALCKQNLLRWHGPVPSYRHLGAGALEPWLQWLGMRMLHLQQHLAATSLASLPCFKATIQHMPQGNAREEHCWACKGH